MEDFIRQGGLTEDDDLLTAYKTAKSNEEYLINNGIDENQAKEQAKEQAMKSVIRANKMGDFTTSPDLEKKWTENQYKKIYNADRTKENAYRAAVQQLRLEEHRREGESDEALFKRRQEEEKQIMENNNDETRKAELARNYERYKKTFEANRSNIATMGANNIINDAKKIYRIKNEI